MRQKHAPARPRGPAPAHKGASALQGTGLLGRDRKRTPETSQRRGPALPERRAVELHDPRRECGPALAALYEAFLRRDQGTDLPQARARRPCRIRGLLPVRNQRRYAQARRACPRTGDGPRNRFL